MAAVENFDNMCDKFMLYMLYVFTKSDDVAASVLRERSKVGADPRDYTTSSPGRQ
jgi:hypothetical protein